MHPVVAALTNLGITHAALQLDSRKVQHGDVFFAFPGRARDGRDFIDAAISNGAAAIVCERGDPAIAMSQPMIEVEHLEKQLGEIAHDYYGQPSARIAVHGVTGTNGKTTVATWLAQAHEAIGERCGFIGTIGRGFLPDLIDTSNTTPDAIEVHRSLAEFRDQGATAAAMEVSSHALDQGRVNGVRFASAIFTNLTQDHLDYHGTMEAYGAAKAKLFTDLPARHRVINADDEFGASLLARKLPGSVSYGLKNGDVRARIVTQTGTSLTLEISSPWGAIESGIATVGTYNVYNALAVAATLLTHGKPTSAVAKTLASLRPASGRLERVSVPGGDGLLPCVWVDYAHTPDALAKAIAAVRESTRGALWVVFGCGGNRDRTKRPIMGEIAANGGDRVVVTSDNPRGELPEVIAEDITAGISSAKRGNLTVELDRKQAIAFAITQASPSDHVLIAGKGHETYQEIAGVRHPFSDVEVAKAILQSRAAANARGGRHATH